jgi:hypothetical protein
MSKPTHQQILDGYIGSLSLTHARAHASSSISRASAKEIA